MNPQGISIAPELFIDALTAVIGFNVGITSYQVVETNSPVLMEKIQKSHYNTESFALHNFINFQSSEKHLNSFYTPVFEPDLKKSMSKSISLDTLNNIAKLEDNWNGYSAKSIPNEVLFLCRKIIISLDYQPEIYPTARRTIQMEYEKSDRSYLEFEVYSDKITILEVPKRQYANAKKREIPAGNYKSLSEIVNEFCGGIGEWENSTMPESYIA